MPPLDFPKGSSGLATVTEEGRVPRSRLDDFTAALSVVEHLREAGEERNRKAAMIRGQFDGNPPFNPGKLRQAGMAYYPNFNTLEAKAYKASAKVPYYDLFASAPWYAEVTLDLPDPDLVEVQSRAASEEWDRTLRGLIGFEYTMGKLIDDYVGFGKGFLVWTDTVSWKPRRVAWHRVLFPDATDVDPEEWEYFAILRDFTVHELYNKVRNAEKARLAGWNVENVFKALRTACKVDPATQRDWPAVQQQLKDHDLYVDSKADKVEAALLFVREFDGRWSQFVLPVTRHFNRRPSEPDASAGFLFRRTGMFERVDHIVAPFFFDVDDGSVNGLSGLGKDIFAPMQHKDRLACATVNGAHLRSSILMQAQSGNARQKAALVQIGNVCVIPEGYNVQQGTILSDIEATITVNAQFDRMLQANTGIYRPQFEKPPGNPETATGAQLRFMQGTVLTNSAVNRFHAQLDRAYGEMYRRIVKASDPDARRFRQWCRERGVPEASLARVRSVRSYRNIGNGSAFLRQNNIASLLPLYPEFPEDGKQNFLEDAVAAYTNQQKVERYVTTPGREGVPTTHVWEANVENDSLSNGRPVVWTPQQEDTTHLAIHASAAQQALDGLQSGGDPAAIAVFVQAVVAHGVSAHIASLQRKGRKAEVKQWLDVYKRLGQEAQQLAQAVQRQAQEQARLRQQQGEQLSDQQLKAAELSGKMQLAGMKTQHQMLLREQQAEQKMRLADASTSADISRSTATAIADQRRKDLTAGDNGQ